MTLNNINSNWQEPFWLNTASRMCRRGHFWIPGERVSVKGQTLQRGPMFVQWETPEHVTQPYPIIMVHGGLLQGTEWMDTPDGRPGWAQRMVEAGYAVLVVDRPGHGRSHIHPDVAGPAGHAFSYEEGEHVFFPPEDADKQTQWPFDPNDPHMLDSFIAAFGPLPTGFRESQEMDTARLSTLLDKIGPAILMTHSASGPLGWNVADQRPKQVVAIVSIEPMGPAFATAPGIGKLDWGLTAAPVTYYPEFKTPEEVRTADPMLLKIPTLTGMPIAIVTGEASTFAKNGPSIVSFLNKAGASAHHIHLPDYGISGNGHGLIYEKNSDEALKPVLNWLDNYANAKDTRVKSKPSYLQSGKVTLHITYNDDKKARFDRDYYVNVHLPLVMQIWGTYGLESTRALFPTTEYPGTIAICECIFKDRAAIGDAFFAPLTSKIMEDIQNFTDVAPTRSIAEPLEI